MASGKGIAALIPRLGWDVLPTHDLRLLKIEDTSVWLHMEDEPSYIDVTVPGSKTAITNYFQKGKINRFNSNLLNLTCTNCEGGLGTLPDGIYKIKVYSCDGADFYYEAYYLRTVKVLLDLDMILIGMNLHLSCADTSFLDKYLEIELLLTSASSLVRQGYINEGKCAYDKAVELVDNLKNCNDGKCK